MESGRVGSNIRSTVKCWTDLFINVNILYASFQLDTDRLRLIGLRIEKLIPNNSRVPLKKTDRAEGCMFVVGVTTKGQLENMEFPRS